MAFKDTVTLKDAPTTYVINPDVKRYALADTGFSTTPSGNFQLIRSLDPDSPFNESNQIKIVIAKDLSGFKLSVTDANGLQAVNIFKSDKTANQVEQFNFIMNNLVEREIFTTK